MEPEVDALSDERVVFNQINLVVGGMAAMVEFYERLGAEFAPTFGTRAGQPDRSDLSSDTAPRPQKQSTRSTKTSRPRAMRGNSHRGTPSWARGMRSSSIRTGTRSV